ncbi:BEM1 Bud emergence protein 1 [Candida maltosa Xu316]
MSKVSTTVDSLPLRSLTISKPKSTIKHEISSNLKCNIILVSKYSFQAETENELTIKKGDILKLLDRLDNGWLLVKFIDRVQPPGLIPATYVDIAVNDSVNPITLSWLQQYQQNHNDIIHELNYLDLQFNKVESKFKTINNKPYPIQASISNFLLYNNRYWYRLDVEYSDKSKSFLCRYYQDFYNLHIGLFELMEKLIQKNSITMNNLKLPKLPEPIPEEEDNEESELISLLLKRCNDLNVYMNKLMLNKYYQTSTVLIDWLELKDLPGFTITEESELSDLTNDEINDRILDGSINVVKNYNEKLHQRELLLKQKEIDELKHEKLPERSKSKNIYNNYQQAIQAMNRSNTVTTNGNNRKASVSSSNSPPTNHNSLIGNSFHKTNETSPTSSSSSPKSHHNKFRTSEPNYILSSSPNNKPKYSNNNQPLFQSAATPPLPQLHHPPYQHQHQQQPQTNSPKLSVNTNFHSPKLNNYQSPIISNHTSFPSPIMNTNSPNFSSPVQAKHTSNNNNRHQFIKCKILDNNGDIIAIKLNKSTIKSISDFKNLIKLKINYQRNLFIKLPNLNNFENIDVIKFNIIEFLRFNDKVYLKID